MGLGACLLLRCLCTIAKILGNNLGISTISLDLFQAGVKLLIKFVTATFLSGKAVIAGLTFRSGKFELQTSRNGILQNRLIIKTGH